MTNKRAAEILQRQIDRLQSKDINYDLWVIQTEYYIKEFFKEASFQYKYSDSLFAPQIHEQNYNYKLESFITKNTNFLKNCIEIINEVGIKSPEGRNYLYRFNDAWLTVILSIGITFIFGIGVFYQKYSDNRSYKIDLTSSDSMLPALQEILIHDIAKSPKCECNHNADSNRHK